MSDENLHDELTDSIVTQFFKDNEDLALVITIDWIEDLGLRVMVSSDGERSFARSGSLDSVTDALNKAITKAVPKIQEDREYKAKLEAAFDSDLREGEND